MAPAGKTNRFIRMGIAEIATSVGTVTMNHFGACSSTGKRAKPDGYARPGENRMREGNCQGGVAARKLWPR
jgi:hypothetical protein